MSSHPGEPPVENAPGGPDVLGQKLDRIAAALEKLNSLSEQEDDGKEQEKGGQEGDDKKK